MQIDQDSVTANSYHLRWQLGSTGACTQSRGGGFQRDGTTWDDTQHTPAHCNTFSSLPADQTNDFAEREVKKANRELNSQTAKMSDIQKIEHLTKRCSDLLAEMKRHERDNIKNKRRADQLQKDKDQGRSELTKNTGLKEKLEKLCRELQKENNKLKVS